MTSISTNITNTAGQQIQSKNIGINFGVTASTITSVTARIEANPASQPVECIITTEDDNNYSLGSKTSSYTTETWQPASPITIGANVAFVVSFYNNGGNAQMGAAFYIDPEPDPHYPLQSNGSSTSTPDYDDYTDDGWQTPNSMNMTLVYDGSTPSAGGTRLPPPPLVYNI